MFVIVPLICFVFIFLCVHVKSRHDDEAPCWRASFIAAAVIWGLLLTIITEALSVFSALTFGWVLGLWGLAAFVSGCMCFIFIRKARPTVRFAGPRVRPFDVVLLLGMGSIVGATCLIGLMAPPNTWFPLNDHMGRIVHWMQNRSVTHYPTNAEGRLCLSPFAQFAVMHFQILSGGDRFANLVQCLGLAGSIIGVSLIAKQLGASARGQILASVVSATIPMGILQASGAQNDLVVGFWLICCVYYLMLLMKREGRAYCLGAGASLGLAILTKATAYLYAPAFLVWYGLSKWKAHSKKWHSSLIVIVLVAFLINLGFYARNMALFGHPLGPHSEIRQHLRRTYTARMFVTKIVRNLGLHMGTPFPRLNALPERVLRSVDAHLGIENNDPRVSWRVPYYAPPTSYNENLDGNPMHLILIAVAIGIIVLSKDMRKSQALVAYSLCAVFAFLLFSLYMLRRSYHSRLHLALFMLWSPVIGTVLCEKLNRKITNCIALVLIVSALPWVFLNRYRPLVGERSVFKTSRTDKYFVSRPQMKEGYDAAAEFVINQQCSEVGLCLGRFDWEYPFWVLLREKGGEPIRLEHVNVQNVSAKGYDRYPFKNFSPGVIFSVGVLEGPEAVVGGAVYRKARSWGPVHVFIRQ